MTTPHITDDEARLRNMRLAAVHAHFLRWGMVLFASLLPLILITIDTFIIRRGATPTNDQINLGTNLGNIGAVLWAIELLLGFVLLWRKATRLYGIIALGCVLFTVFYLIITFELGIIYAP